MSKRPTVETQAQLTDGGIRTSAVIDTDLADWDIHDPGKEPETEIEIAVASSIEADDREIETEQDSGEQSQLFPDVEDDQQTLSGKDASTQSMW